MKHMNSTAKARATMVRNIVKMIYLTLPDARVVTTEKRDERACNIDLETGVKGLRASMTINAVYAWVLINWHAVDKDARLVPNFSDSVNQSHGHKATTVAYSADELYTKLDICLHRIAKGAAFV